MNGTPLLLRMIVVAAALVTVGCGSTDEANDDTATTVVETTVADTSADTASTMPADPDGGTEPSDPETPASGGGGTIEAALSTGDTISGATEVCVNDGTAGSITADDGQFTLDFDASSGNLNWNYDGGSITETVSVMINGSSLTLSGMTADGIGFNAEITCG